jgi:4-diphosphocytidyl-2-C-methyl-D-erythritol kinase
MAGECLTRYWPAPAKLNRFLHVTGRRDDGYHELQTIFQFLDYGDELAYELNETGEITHRQPLPGIEPENELCLRAARALQQESGTRLGVSIEINKRLPAGGGLGGGSSDAATTLIALNELWGLGLSREQLAEIGLRLGADVPVFLFGKAAWAEGVGEILTPVELDEPWYLVICPDVSVSTGAIFSDPELTRDSPAITIRAFREGAARNDLEELVRRRYPEVDQVLTRMAQNGQPRMTGSGACVFMQVDSREQGEQLLATMLDEMPDGTTGFVAKGQNRHPLYQ